MGREKRRHASSQFYSWACVYACMSVWLDVSKLIYVPYDSRGVSEPLQQPGERKKGHS
jgi:hypothetical protein